MALHVLAGLNPYGFNYTLGLQETGTAHANPAPAGIDGFIATAREIGARCIEFDHRWLTPMTNDALETLADRIEGMTPICSFWLSQTPGETLEEAVRCAGALGASRIRMHLTPVLAGARASWGPAWNDIVTHARETLAREAPRVADAGLELALENHQDFDSDELLEIADASGDHVGLTFDTGNPLAVGEDPVAFASRVATRVRHVHLKDYRAQFTPEGYRLVRCAIGEGCIPFEAIAAALAEHHTSMTAALEPGALEARHVRAFTSEWWAGYGTRDADEFARALRCMRAHQLDDAADVRTPWERQGPPAEIVSYEMDQVRRSAAYVRTLGWL